MNGMIQCLFDGGRKKKSSKSKKSTKRGVKKATSSYCYKCNSMTMDKMAVVVGNVRDSNCAKCSSKRSVFAH